MPGGMHYGRGGFGRGGRGGGGGNFGVMLLIANVMRIGLEHIPPVTLGVVALCTSLYLGLLPMARGLDSGNTCFNFMALAAVLGIGGGRLAGPGLGAKYFLPNLSLMSKRLAMSNFFHANDFHLYYNMMSWLYKGRNYELVYGSEFMLLWLIAAVIGVSLMYCFICCGLLLFGIPVLEQLFGGATAADDGIGGTLLSWLEPDACVVGFSSVIFCLKTVLNYYNVQAHGEIDEQIFIPFLGPLFATPLRHAVWAELFVCQLFSATQVSFIGHLAGIATGAVFIACDLVGWLQPFADSLRAIREGRGRGAAPRGQQRRQQQQDDDDDWGDGGGGGGGNNRGAPRAEPPLNMPQGAAGGFG